PFFAGNVASGANRTRPGTTEATRPRSVESGGIDRRDSDALRPHAHGGQVAATNRAEHGFATHAPQGSEIGGRVPGFHRSSVVSACWARMSRRGSIRGFSQTLRTGSAPVMALASG